MHIVRDGERLSGFPEILIADGERPGGGSLMCSIQCFHWADVVVKGGTTELWFENKTCLTIPNGIVQYPE